MINMATYPIDWTLTMVGGLVFFAGLLGLFLIANKPNIAREKAAVA